MSFSGIKLTQKNSGCSDTLDSPVSQKSPVHYAYFLVDEEYYPNLYILLHIIYFDTSKKDKIDEHIDCSELMFSGSKANWKRSWYIYDCFIYSIKLNCCAMYHSSRVNRMICLNKFFNIYYCLFFNKNCT